MPRMAKNELVVISVIRGLNISGHEMIESSSAWLQNYCEKENYKGWDPFDGLNSRIFRYSPLYKSRILCLAWIQLFKRSPINFRKIILVLKGYNAKGLALFASGLISTRKCGRI